MGGTRRALKEQPQLGPFMWQRGIALYYDRQFEEAARQFRQDVAVNGNDTEEALWAFLAEAQLNGADVARTQMLKVGSSTD
jgi:lipoprotein NlpI